ncbi:MAG: hypothetical protein ACR2J3_07960 [Aridibacter sp.]
MDEAIFWQVLDEILNFGEFIVAVPNSAASANIVRKISIGKDGRERVINKDICHCHVHLKPKKISRFSFTFIEAGFGDEPACELKTPQDETVLRLYLRGSKEFGSGKFAAFLYKDSEFVNGNW